jgi:GNAT superfamily N-acetyltransferase
MSELHIRPATEADLEALAAFMRTQGAGGADADYLRHWYFRNPSCSASVVLGELEGRIVGMATTNDHHFVRQGQRALVAMPQKVLTDANVRGRGIFGKLYRAAETAALERGVDFFLTVTNAASTPIFLERFGYRRLPSPRAALLPAVPGRCRLVQVERITTAIDAGPAQAWAMERSTAHRAWRYDHVLFPEYLLRTMPMADGVQRTAVLRHVKRMGLPMLLLLDLWPMCTEHDAELLAALRRLAWAERAAGVLLLEDAHMHAALRGQWPVLRRSSGFNLLLKGQGPEQEAQLVEQGFDLAFGDLDFF